MQRQDIAELCESGLGDAGWPLLHGLSGAGFAFGRRARGVPVWKNFDTLRSLGDVGICYWQRGMFGPDLFGIQDVD